MKQKGIPADGSVFLVPLSTRGFCIGVLVRADGKGRAYGAFFGKRVAVASEVDVAGLKLQDAALCCRFGDHGLHTQRWAVIGSIPDWDASPWPIPKFARRHDNPAMRYVTEYDDELNFLSESLVQASEAQDFPEDAQLGSGLVEIRLDKLLR